MGCLVCYISYVGGLIGGYIGVSPPEHTEGRVFSALITANLVNITSIALKSMFNISLCFGGGFNLENVIRVLGKTVLVGFIYSIGVNYLLGRYIFLPKQNEEILKDNQQEIQIPHSCCSKK